MNHVVVSVTVLLLVYYTAAQDGGCSPPPSTLISSSGSLFSNNVPMINAQADILQPIVGGHRTNPWAVFSATQVQQHGLWCQVRLEDTGNTPNSNIGDWYYPTTDGYTLLPNTTTDNTPYQSLKCNNQIGLVVDGNTVTNYQGIMKCNTTVPNLNRYENYFVVYDDNVFNNYPGPTVEPTMRVFILSSRDTILNIVLTMSFNVTFGPPSSVFCRYGSKTILNNKRDDYSDLSREVIRSQYVNSSQPDMTRVTVKVVQPIRVMRTYTCQVNVEGRMNIVSGSYNFLEKGSGTTTVIVTVAGTPTVVTASRTGYTSVLVSWTASSPQPAGYEVFYQTSNMNRFSGGNTSNTELTLTGMQTLGAKNWIFVVAFGEEGAPVLPSHHSATAVITLTTQIPQLPDTLSLTSISSSIMVSWSSPEEFAADSYNVSYSCQNFCDSQQTSSDTVSGTATTHTISSLNTGNSSCTVNVTAVFGSSTSNTVTDFIYTASAAPTGAPEELTNTSVESRSLSVAWEAVPCPHQGGPITGYRLHYSNGSDSYTVNITGEENTQYNLTGLTPFTNYSVQVAAVNDIGTGPYSTPLTVETLQDVPSPISGLLAIPEVVQLHILWIPPSEPNGVITAYEVCFNISVGVFNYTNTSSTQHTLRDLPPNTVVTFSVRAYTIIGPGEYVMAGQKTTGRVPLVSGITVVPLNSTSVRVSWTPVNQTVVDHYTVHYTTVGGVNGTVSFPATSSSGVVSGLQGGQEYWFSVTVTLHVNEEFYTGSFNHSMKLMLMSSIYNSSTIINSMPPSTYISPTMKLSSINNDGYPDTTLSSLPSSPTSHSTDSSPEPIDSVAAAGAIVVVLVVVIAIIIILVIFVIIRKRKNSSAFAVHYLKEGPKVDQTDNDKTGYASIACYKPLIEEFPGDLSVVEGNKVLLPVKVIGSPQPILTWYHNNTRLGNDYAHEISSDGSLTIITAEMRHSGNYRLVATNSEGTVEKQFSLKVVSEEDDDEGPTPTATAEVVKSKPVPVDGFGQYVSQNHANSNKGFTTLYNSLESGERGHPVTVGVTAANKPLNRFKNITVYDDNRIVLQPLSGSSDCQKDYINASYVDGYEKQHKFIACQGPLSKTVVDFWRMIWQEKVYTVVMVTNLKENKKIKCQQYWPESGSKSYGTFMVTITDQQVFADYTIRLLQLQLEGSSEYPRMVTQYHFTSWPDHDVPEYATSILTYHRRITKDHKPSMGLMVVHCSAGVGRTGTFIAIDTILEQVKQEKMVDVAGVITKMRHQRMKMVQTANQFTFIHDVILESVTCGDTQINSGDLRSTTLQMRTTDQHTGKTGFATQFETLNQVTPNPSQVKVKAAVQHKNKNRSMEFLPPDKHRVQLKGVVPDYIHATFVNGYKHRKAFIVAQNPMESTTRDFWKMIVERECTVVVMLCGLEENGQEVCHQYWPAACGGTDKEKYTDLSVETTQENKYDGYTERILSVTDKSGKSHQVTQFHILNWDPQGSCPSPQTIIAVVEEVYKVQRRTDNKPIVVHCSDTVSRSGMFCAIATTIDRCKAESVVDVFQVVKAQRIQKPGLVLTVEQYQFVFEAVLTFLESFETYSNFK